MSDLTSKVCIACEGGATPLTNEQIAEMLAKLTAAWDVLDGKKIRRTFQFANFAQAMEFVNKVAALAEQEGHHPDIHIVYNKVTFELWTHAIGGLSENDFILAAKIEQL
ncbi:4a-hydroxytetrahydrobiopterin dehydratase [Candidatus Uhrbacteria bacterium RIFOXYB12_FULL_58_10]|uniref:Putative pterin-4-alpha-carbinolamine dehydratase n=1 Tax=Candidatus Uhrbacteria bacterium RIFOXYB2_FULL_57_15 TaxID=1802422 RepID=A0A1F7WA47_9BACT|nr:MAG: 4a-hydroxytetrahydrobiopterin dehydratase [Candidatus Uhrbacteria bacterium RIFOXYB12_FULL_58_10]OGL99057.1 MAG: 4a-hydroxytetrahydrobiopterin dehydratase [Candidatus Uhrbacteria bacterium RIFOXYB2_FULL_57_15]OGM00277.1 MAG: 4a-hydroxytetrahydrobiopterin dehydratase [Candidatus Uhrbacteria bacterium RIFOXYC12_FULL_57_11]